MTSTEPDRSGQDVAASQPALVGDQSFERLPNRMHRICLPGMNVSTTLRRAIEHCGKSRYEIAKKTGIAQSMLSRFVTAKRGLSINAVDRLSMFLKLELVSRKRGTRQGG